MLKALPVRLDHLQDDQKRDIFSCVLNDKYLFIALPTSTLILKNDVVVKTNKSVKKNHPNHLNPEKRVLMKQETDYLVKHVLPSLVPGALHVWWKRNLMEALGSLQTLEMSTRSQFPIPIL